MKNTTLKITLQVSILLVFTAFLAGPSVAADLVAIEGRWTPPGGSDTVTMWGFATDDTQGCGSLPDWTIGPQLTATAGGSLTINLRNCLSEPVSIIIQGQPATLAPERRLDGRVTSLTATVTAGGTDSYTWNNLKPGTFVYHSAANLAKQVHMGLYGALTVEAAGGQAYPGIAFNSQTVLFFSEIDPALHDPPAFAHSNNYNPRYFLVNGQPYTDGAAVIPAGSVNQTTLVRMLSACMNDLVPTLMGASWELVAEDGNKYPFPRIQHTVLLSALKTKDALFTPTQEGAFTVFDRRGNLTNDGLMPGGMMAKLQVGNTTGAPVANPDTASVVEGGTVTELVSAATSVLDNDIPNTDVDAVLVENVLNGSLTLNIDGTFEYTHNGSETTEDAFTYRTNDGSQNSNIATVTITITPENDAPVAVDDVYDVVADSVLSVPPPGVLGNDSDPDGPALEAKLFSGPTAGTLTVFNSDGSFDFDATGLAAGAEATFVYEASDSLSTIKATVTIAVTAPPTNQPPVAEPDFATTTRNTAKTIDLAGNDSDPDGNLDPNSVIVPTGSSRGGTITNLGNGSVVYTPRRNFRGTDTFTYVISDSADPALSDSATVTVNVVK